MGAADGRLVPVLVGPTGVGKTAVAAALAGDLEVAVISADSRQVYRGLDVGTAKPAASFRAGVPHYGLDLVEIGERYSAGRFARDAAAWLAEVRAGGRQPLVVGGTGFYVRALAEGLFREPPLDPLRRAGLGVWAAVQPRARLAQWATRLDREYSSGGAQRAARAIEIALLTGRPLSWWQRRARGEATMRPWYVLLTLPRAELHRRITRRAQEMVARGIVEETSRALAEGHGPAEPGLDAIGYREVVAHLEGRLSAAGLADAIAASTRRYAKRQETWFRQQLVGGPVWTLDATQPPEALAGAIRERWQAVVAP